METSLKTVTAKIQSASDSEFDADDLDGSPDKVKQKNNAIIKGYQAQIGALITSIQDDIDKHEGVMVGISGAEYNVLKKGISRLEDTRYHLNNIYNNIPSYIDGAGRYISTLREMSKNYDLFKVAVEKALVPAVMTHSDPPTELAAHNARNEAYRHALNAQLTLENYFRSDDYNAAQKFRTDIREIKNLIIGAKNIMLEVDQNYRRSINPAHAQ